LGTSFAAVLPASCRSSLHLDIAMADVANLEAAFERTTINDENDDQVASTTTTTTYHKTKVCINSSVV
jgi:hypothetical protein